MKAIWPAAALAAALAAVRGIAFASDLPADAAARIEALTQRLDAQRRHLDALKADLAEQDAQLVELRRALDAQRRGAVEPAAAATAAAAAPPRSASTSASASAPPPVDVATGPADASAAPSIAPIFDQPGVLTPAGRAVFEPSLQYAYSSSNRIALVGYTVIPAILVGLIDVREVKRTTFTGAVAGRYGLTNRFEIEAKLPYVYRSDVSVGREFLQGASADSAVFDAHGHGIGDAEATARWQLNDGGVDKPYFVGSLRLKSRTGTDPFEVVNSRSVVGFRNDGVQKRLPTGSGFYGLQPAATALYPSDPAVFFGTVSYLHSFARKHVVLDTDEGPEPLGDVAPGGIFGFNFGMGMALNARSSFSLGYDHSAVARTRIDGRVANDSVPLQLGSLLLGLSYRLDANRSVNVSLGAGLTRDTPDVTLTLRVPTTF